MTFTEIMWIYFIMTEKIPILMARSSLGKAMLVLETSNPKSPEISKKTRTSKTPKNVPHKDIRSFFVSQPNNEMQRKKGTGKTVVVLSDTD